MAGGDSMLAGKSWWTILRSMKMGLYLVLTIAAASIVGTLVPQHPDGPGSWVEKYLQLGDLYHSWWYITLLGILTLNILACSFYRFKTILLNKNRVQPLLESRQIEKLNPNVSFTLAGSNDEIKNRINDLLVRLGLDVWSDSANGKYRIGAQHGRFAVWGSIITHLSFIVIMVGILIGVIFGYQGTMDIPVGDTVNLTDMVGVDKGHVKNDFQVRIDGFWIEPYPNGSPAGYYSRMTILENDKSVQTATIGVNDPLNYQGTKFYQARYGEAIEIQVNGQDGSVIQQGTIVAGDRFKVEGTNLTIVPYLHNPENEAAAETPLKSTQPTQSRVIYLLLQGEQRVGMGAEGFDLPISLGQDGTTFTFQGTVPYTGLQVKKDPGVPLIWLGSVLMLLGMGFSFFGTPYYLWIAIEQHEKWVAVYIGGRTTKNRLGLADRIGKLAHDIQSQAV